MILQTAQQKLLPLANCWHILLMMVPSVARANHRHEASPLKSAQEAWLRVVIRKPKWSSLTGHKWSTLGDHQEDDEI
jgi:hypothetical protein